MDNKSKYIKSSGWLFLGIYLFLIGLSTLHYHHYDFNEFLSLSNSSSGTEQSNDIVQDFSGSCIIHHFANTVLNYFYSSSEVLKTRPLFTGYFNFQNSFNTSQIQNSSIGLRAPPALV